MKDPPNLHTHTQLGSFGVVKFCSLRGEGRRSGDGRLKNRVRMKQMITFDYIKFSFLLTYHILVIYNYFAVKIINCIN